jgi:hypothetical protein
VAEPTGQQRIKQVFVPAEPEKRDWKINLCGTRVTQYAPGPGVLTIGMMVRWVADGMLAVAATSGVADAPAAPPQAAPAASAAPVLATSQAAGVAASAAPVPAPSQDPAPAASPAPVPATGGAKASGRKPLLPSEELAIAPRGATISDNRELRLLSRLASTDLLLFLILAGIAVATSLPVLYFSKPTFGAFADYTAILIWAIGIDQSKNLIQLLNTFSPDTPPKPPT